MKRAWQAEQGARRLQYDDVRAARMDIRVVGRPKAQTSGVAGGSKDSKTR